jgi:BirA family biotin operon repressor/biotin-[acetyl-CoA-carboxylase] ligase
LEALERKGTSLPLLSTDLLLLETIFTGKYFTRLEKTDSTNLVALRLIHSGQAVHGQVIQAQEQIQGRGQRGKSWESAYGQNLLVSFIYKLEEVPVDRAFYWSMAVALAVKKTIDAFTFGARIEIKWPNDILLRQHKVAGILVENILGTGGIKWTVAGIGINVNQVFSERDDRLFPPNSLANMSGQQISGDEVLGALMMRMERAYFQMRGKETDAILAAYNDCLFAKEYERKFNVKGTTLSAEIIGVDGKGMLQIRDNAGKKLSFHHGEINYL